MKKFIKYLLSLIILFIFLYILIDNSEIFALSLEQNYTADRGEYSCTFEEDSLYLDASMASTAMFCDEHGAPYFFKKDTVVMLKGTVAGKTVNINVTNGGTFTVWGAKSHPYCTSNTSYSLQLYAQTYSGDGTIRISAACGDKLVNAPGPVYATGRISWKEKAPKTVTNNVEAYILAEARANIGLPRNSYPNVAWWNRTSELAEKYAENPAGDFDDESANTPEAIREAIDEALSDVNAEITALNKEKSTLQSQKEALERSLEEIENKITVLNNEIDQLKAEIASNNAKINSNNSKINADNTAITEKNVLLQEKREALAEKEDERQTLVNSGSDTSTVDDEIAILQSEISDLESDISSLETEISSLESENTRLTAANNNKQQSIDSKNAQIANYRLLDDDSGYYDSMAGINEKIDAIDADIEEIDNQINALEGDKSSIEASRDSKIASAEKFKELMDSLAIENISDQSGYSASTAAGLLHEAQIFESMHKVINDNYMGTVEDLTNVKNVKVVYDATEKKYLVGPFQIKYCEVYANKNQFAGITGTPILTLYKDSQKIEKNLGDGWGFSYDGSRRKVGTLGDAVPSNYNVYPHTTENFYIVIDYEEGINKLGGLSLNFRYLTATATYAETEGEIEKMAWTTSDLNWTECSYSRDCETHGSHECDNYTKATITVTVGKVDTIPVQRFIRVHRATRKYDKKEAVYTGDIKTESGGIGSNKLFVWQIDLTTTLAGNVWVDKDPQKDSNAVNGIRNTNVEEEKKSIVNIAVTVYLYDSSGKKQREAIAHEANGNRISWPIYTEPDGSYEVNRLEAPGSGKNYFYVVEFEYDGQVYKNTIYLGNPNSVTAGNAAQGLSSTYKVSALASENKYFNSSMAVEEVQDRYVFDQTFGEITGDSSIDGSGNTTGFTNTTDVNGDNPQKGDNIKYYSNGVTSDEEDTTKNKADDGLVISKLDSAAQNTSGSNQKVTSGSGYERYRMVASTWYNDTDTYGVDVTKDNFRIQYPLEGWTYVMNNKTSGDKRYINDYMLHINLGLIGRAKTDISVLKDIYKMEIVVNEQEVVQEFNVLGETETGFADLKILLEKSRGEGYTLGLYGSDVSYSSLKRYQNAIEQVQDLKEYTELRVFVTYAVRVYNNSETNDVRINEITDYYDKSYTLIDKENSSIYGYKDDVDEKGVYASIVGEDMRREEKCVADTPYYRILSSENAACAWEPTKAQNLTAPGVISSGELEWSAKGEVDGMNKSTSTTLRGLKLKVNEYAEIFTTYEIDYDGFLEMAGSEADDTSIREGNDKLWSKDNNNTKNNIVEVSNYSTFYSDLDTTGGIYRAYNTGWVSGRVDKDSAPNNIDRNDLDNMAKYEDDTCLAIPLSVTLETVVRDMYGYVFEDAKNNETISGYDLTDGTKLKVGNGIYDSGESLIKNVKVSLYEVINLGDVSDNSDYENLEYYYEVPEECYNNDNGGFTTDTDSGNGNYYISEFLAGDYVLRFDYGTIADDTATIYTTDESGGTASSTSEIIKYNGQDYENTSYLSGAGATINDKYLNLRTEDTNGVKAVINTGNAKAYSVARDNESRRMVVDAYSRTIENDRAEILRDRVATDEYVKATKMFAETPIMQIEIFDPAQLDKDVYPGEDKAVVVKNTDKVSSTTEGFSEHKYHIGNINFGLEKRANTDIDIEQYINKIVLQKDGENIFSASLDEDGNVIVSDPNSAHLDKLTYMTHVQTMDAATGLYQQGFYAISVEDEYLNGLTMKITYKMKVINNSEVDFTGYLSRYYKASEIINKATYPPTTDSSNDYINKLLADDDEHGISMNSTLAEILKLFGTNEVGMEGLLSTADLKEISTENSDKNISINDSIRPDIIVYGKYVGRFYYENKVDESTKAYNIVNYRDNGFPDMTITYDGDKVVTTTVNQLIDYIDANASYDLSTQGYENRSWDLSGTIDSTITDRETIPSLNALVSKYSYREINEIFNIYDENDNALVTDLSSNIVLSDGKILEKMASLSGNEVDSTYPSYLDKVLNEDRVEYVDNYDGISLLNTNLNYELQPKNAKVADGTYNEATMYLTTTKVTASDTDANNMKFDNLVEVLVYSNTTGRRDVTSVPGNAMALATKEDIGFWKAGYNSKGIWDVDIDEAEDWTNYPEDDQYAPEYVTIIAPTGIALRDYVKNVIIPITVLSIILVIMLGAFGVKQYKIIRKRKEF